VSVQDYLREAEARDFEEYKRGLRREEARSQPMLPVERLGYEADDPGYPLGRGMPLGRTLREDGETHRQAWMRVIRGDPCSFCGRAPAGTVDHIEPQSKRARGLGGAHSWLNFTGACEGCNSGKKDMPMLTYLLRRRIGLGAKAALRPAA
jgi:hypothetical protein